MRERALSPGCQRVAEHLTEFLGRHVDFAVSATRRISTGIVGKRVAQPRIGEIEAQHTDEYIKKSLNDLRWLTATPDAGRARRLTRSFMQR